MWGHPEKEAIWMVENRRRYNRDTLRYPSDLMPEEWGLGEPLIRPAKPGGNRRRVNVREVMNGILHVLSAGCPYRFLSLVRKIILLAISRHQGKRLQ